MPATPKVGGAKPVTKRKIVIPSFSQGADGQNASEAVSGTQEFLYRCVVLQPTNSYIVGVNYIKVQQLLAYNG